MYWDCFSQAQSCATNQSTPNSLPLSIFCTKPDFKMSSISQDLGACMFYTFCRTKTQESTRAILPCDQCVNLSRTLCCRESVQSGVCSVHSPAPQGAAQETARALPLLLAPRSCSPHQLQGDAQRRHWAADEALVALVPPIVGLSQHSMARMCRLGATKTSSEAAEAWWRQSPPGLAKAPGRPRREAPQTPLERPGARPHLNCRSVKFENRL